MRADMLLDASAVVDGATDMGNEARFITADVPGDHIVRALGVGPAGAVYVVGRYQNTLTWQGQSVTSVGDWDVFVGKLVGDDLKWLATLGSMGADSARSVVLRDNAVVIAGYVGGDVLASTDTYAGGRDGMLATLDEATGAVRWVRLFGGAAGDELFSVSLHGNGMLACGFASGPFVVDGHVIGATAQTAHLLAKLSAGGVFSWAEIVDGAGNDGCLSLATSGEATFVTGFYGGPIQFVGESLPHTGSFDVYVARVATQGIPGNRYTWQRGFGGTGLDVARDMVVADGVHPVIVGQHGGSMTVGAVTLQSPNPAAFLVELDGTNGGVRSALGATDRSEGIAVTQTGAHIVVGGNYRAAFQIGAGGLLPPTQESDVFVLRIHRTDDTVETLAAAGGTGEDFLSDLVVDPLSFEVIAGGSFTGQGLFGSHQTSAQETGLFVWRLP